MASSQSSCKRLDKAEVGATLLCRLFLWYNLNMIQKLGAAFKKMAQRSMLRGNRGDAQAVSEFGIEGMRNNLMTSDSKITHNTVEVNNTAGSVNAINQKETVSKIKGLSTNSSTSNTKVGTSILGALNQGE